MLERRKFLGLTAGLAAGLSLVPRSVRADGGRVFLYDSIGAVMSAYDVDAPAAALSRKGSVSLPTFVQFAWPHPHLDILYVASSGRGEEGAASYLSALAIDPGTGALAPLGAPIKLRTRANHMSVDRAGGYLLSAHPTPCELVIHGINPDGSVGEEVRQSAPNLDFGLYAHQARAMPSNRSIVLVTRGNDPAKGRPEDPGALKIFEFQDGQIRNRATVAPNNGYGFGARDIDFHPSLPFAYVSLERQNRIYVFRTTQDGIEPAPLFIKETLADPADAISGQIAGDIHIHPNGRVLYVANRGDLGSTDGRGISNIAVFSIDGVTGEPSLMQSEDTRGFHPRTFAIDPDGKMLVAANVRPYQKSDGGPVATEPVSLATFHIGRDGRLTFAKEYQDRSQPGEQQFWCGLIPVPGR